VNDSAKSVASIRALVAASADPGVRRIVVSGVIKGAPTLRLAPGQQLIGETEGAAIVFAPGVDGVRLSSVHEVRDLSRTPSTPGANTIAAPSVSPMRTPSDKCKFSCATGCGAAMSA